MSDMLLQLRVTADGKIAVQELSAVSQAEQRVTEGAGRVGDSTAKAKRETDAWVAALMRKKDTLGMSWAEMKKYEASQLALSEAERRHAGALIDSIAAHERYGAAAERIGRTLGGLAATALQAGVAMAGVIVKESIQAAMEAEQAQLKVAAVLKATGHAAGMTAQDLDDLAESMAASTKFDDESIRNASAILLTFKSVSKDSFGEAMRVAADLASVMGTDLNSAVLMIGKALEEPEQGLTALRRAGVSFSESQKDIINGLVEQGNKAEAITRILEIMKEQGLEGVAQAMNTGLGKATSDLKKGWNELLETIGRTEAVGGTATTYMQGLTQIMKDLQDQISGTSDRFRNFFKSEEFLGSKLHGALRLAGMSDPYGANAQERPRPRKVDHAAELAAQDGRAIQAQKERIELEQKRAREAEKAAAKEAKAYESVVKAADQYLASLERQVASVGATTEQKIMLEAATRALTLKTAEERSAFLASAAALAHQVQVEEDSAAAKRRAADDAKKIAELDKQRVKVLNDGTAAMQRELDQLVKSNDEYGRSRQEIEAATLAKLEHELATKDFTTATYEEIDALEKRVEIQRKIVREGRRADHLEAMKAESEEIKRMAEGMGDAVSEAIMEGGINGADFIKRLFAQLVLRPIVQPIMQDIVGSLFGSGGQGGGLSGLNLLSNLGNIGGIGARLMGGMGSAVNGLGGLLGSSTISQFGAGMAGAVPGTVNFMGPVLPGTTAGTAASFGGEFAAFMSNPVTMAIAAALAIWQSGIFDDGPENPRARLSFGPGSAGSPFGTAGFAMNEGGFDAAAVERFFGSFAGFDRQIARGMSPEQLARIQGRLGAYNTSGRRWDGQPAEFAFPEGDETGGEQLMLEFLHQRYSVVFDELGQDLGNLVRAFEGTSEELGAMIQSLYALTQVGQSIDDMILQITGEAVPLLRGQLDALDTAVANAQDDFATALEGTDPAALLQAEQQLSQAVVNRYNTELGMIRSLQDAIASLKDQAYQFSVQMAQRISAAGGTRDVAAIALGRATQLRSGIGGTAPVGAQIRDLNSYVGAIDTWYQARRQEIEAQIAAEQAAMQAIANAQAAAAEARIAALEEELALAEQFKGLAESARGMIDEMRLTAANPLSVHGRLAMSGGDVARLREEYAGASGTARIGAGERLIDALRTRLSLGGEGFQRPSPEYQAIYNEVIAELTAVQASAQSEAERAAELQTQIVELQRQAAAYQSSIASSSAASQGYLDQLNAEARAYYEYAEAEGARLFEEQERQHQEQLDAITGGMEPELYIAQLQSQTVDELKEIRKAIREWLDTVGAIVGAEPGSGAGEGGAGGGRPSPESEQKIVLEVDGQVLGSVIVPTIDKRIRQSGTVIKRAIANA
jgi:hypothetical protein